jgi:hypothetical protein
MKFTLITGASLLALCAAAPALANPDEARIEELEARLEQLEETNRLLLDVLEAQGLMPGSQTAAAPRAPMDHAPMPSGGRDVVVEIEHDTRDTGHGDMAEHRSDDYHQNLVGVSPEYGYAMLYHAEGVNTRQLTILQAMQAGQLDRRVTLSGGVTALANYQESNSNTKFGWLMRHPTSSTTCEPGKTTQQPTDSACNA